MIVYPAIDLKDGACVRLYQGDLARATVYGTDPAAQAKAFAQAGAAWLHVVDLNGAFAGRPINAAAVAAIAAAVSIPIQLGGGVRDLATVERWLAAGIARVVLGTAAVKDPALVEAACRAHPGRIAVALDARGGKVAVEGWAESSSWTAVDLARRFADFGGDPGRRSRDGRIGHGDGVRPRRRPGHQPARHSYPPGRHNRRP